MFEDLEPFGNEFPINIEFQKINKFVGVFPTEIIKEQPIEVQLLHKDAIAQNSQNKSEIIGLRKSSRIKKSATSSDYVVYLQESEFNYEINRDPTSFS